MANPQYQKRTAVAGVVPTVADFDGLGELILNTTDGKIYFLQSVGGVESVVDVLQAAAALAPVQSVAGRTGAVALGYADIAGLGSMAQQSAASVAITGGYFSGTFSGNPVFSGPVFANMAASATNAQLALEGPSGALAQNSKLRFFSTFQSGTSDTGTRVVARLQAGFSTGAWGNEYLDALVNVGSPNDVQNDNLQAQAVRMAFGATTIYGALAAYGTITALGTTLISQSGNTVSVSADGSVATAVAVAAAGTGFAVNDLLTDATGNLLRVTGESGGVITSLELLRAVPIFSAVPANPVALTVQYSVAGGGAPTADLTWTTASTLALNAGGTVTAPTPAAGDISTKVATTAYCSALSGVASLGFASTLGTKITLWGSAYGLAINANDLALFSGGDWTFRTGTGSGPVVASVSAAGAVTAASFGGDVSGATALATGSTTARTVAARAADVFNVQDFGATLDGILVSSQSVSIAAGSADLTVSGASFVGTDAGKLIVVPGAGVSGAGLFTMISSVSSATSVVLAATASTPLSAIAATISYGTNEASAVASAAAATAGTLVFPNGGASQAPMPSSYPDVVAEYLNTTAINVYALSGEATRYARRVLRGQQGGAHVGTEYSLQHFEARPVGSGIDGPTSADYGVTISHIKQGWPTTTVAGEVDGINIVTRNAGAAGAYNSDSAAILANVGGVGGGYFEVLEAQTSLMDTSGTVLRQIDTQIGVLDPVNNNNMGFFVQSNIGTQNYGLLIHSSANAGWNYFLQFNAATSAGSRVAFEVDGQGQIVLYDAVSASGALKTLRVDGSTLAVVNSAGSAEILTLTDAGDLAVQGSVAIPANFAFVVNGAQVVSNRQTGWGAVSGTLSRAAFDASTASAAVVAETLGALLTDLLTHGLIGP